jgi:hypothetical protein
MARLLKAYGMLLTRWEKRESLGEDYRGKSELILAGLPCFVYGLRLNQMVQLPEA